MIQVQKVSKIYGQGSIQVAALKNVSLTIEKGEFTAIVGPSGSGKTTLLNIIGGLDKPTEGHIEIHGKILNNLAENELIDFRLHHIGFVFQSYNLIPVLTAQENVEFLMLLQKWDKAKRKERAEYLLQQVGLWDQRNKKPSEMSGGQQQRVAVARALATKPEFIMADEPTANLDATSANGLLEIMQTLNESEKTTFVFSTHDQRVIDKARRIVLLHDGVITSDKQL